MKNLYLLFLILITTNYFSQGEGNNWYFGNYAGLSFSTDPPTILNDGRLRTGEGCASVSNKNGDLLFYTNGSKVWDANHNAMPNGTGLFGNSSSTQSAVICPKPGTYNYATKAYDGYYIVTIEVADGVASGGNNAGIRYTEIDMTLNGGMGDVVVANKNVHLFGTSTIEGANVAKHANGCDFWIIGKEVGSNKFNVYHVSTSGVNLTPVTSNAGLVSPISWGSIKVSPNNKIVSFNSNAIGTQVFDFDNSTGTLTLKFSDPQSSYSSDFSPNNNFLYVANLPNPHIYQYDLTAANQAGFMASKTLIGTTANTAWYKACGLQLAPNGKIYVALHTQNRLGVINSPNVSGTACNYDDNGQSIAGTNSFNGTNMTSQLGLPAFPSFFIKEPVEIKSSYMCFNDNTTFKLTDTSDVNNIDWFWTNVGSTMPTTPNSTDWEPSNQFAAAGDYAVMAVAYYPCFTDSIYDTITITQVNNVNLGNDTILCQGGSITLDAGAGYDYYEWHNGDTSRTFVADTTGQYIVKVSNVGENLVFNGDFEQGNVGFSSQYNYGTSSTTPQGSYFVGTNSGSWFSNCPDHTNNSLTSNIMIVDAACGSNGVPGGVNLWCQTVDVSPNTDYVLSLWISNVVSNSPPGRIGFLFDGVQEGPTIESAPVACEWNRYYSVWNSGNRTSVELCINEQTFICSGADFGIDDIFFAPLCTTSDTINVVVGEIPIAEFSLVDSCEYLAVNYTNNSSITPPETIAQYSWDIDNDGTEDYNTQNTSHTFSAGNYTTKLTVTSALGCTKDTTMPVVIYPKPVADFTFTQKCLYDSVPFVDASTVASPDVIIYNAWNFGENALPLVQSTVLNPYNTYSNSGTYNVTQVIATANGCLDTIVKPIDVYYVPNANFNTSNVCLSSSAIFTDQSTVNTDTINQWDWDFGNSATGNNQNETHNYNADGDYTIELIVTTNKDCKDTITQNITVYPMPQVAFSMQDNCLEETTNFTDNSIINIPGSLNYYTWNFGDGNTSNTQNTSHTYTTSGTYGVTLYVTSNNNCLDSLQQDVTIHPLPNVDFIASEICVNEPPTIFTNTSTIQSGTNASYSWSFGDANNTTSTQENPTLNYGNHGNYTVSLNVVSDMGCERSKTQEVKVKHKPTAIFSQDTTKGCAPICINFVSKSLDSTGISSWNWQFENGYGEGNRKYEGYCYNNQGTFDVNLVVTNTEGCKDTAEAPSLITIFGYPTAEFSLTPEVTEVTNSEITFTNSSTDAVTWMWDFKDGTLDSVNYDLSHIYSDTGSYMVGLTVYNANGCSSVVHHQVIILPIENVFVPTAFSPNGDGENDILYVRGYINAMYFSVYDRWGKKVFESNNENIGWDGTIKGKPANEGVYMWYLQTSFNGKNKIHKGDVTLMR